MFSWISGKKNITATSLLEEMTDIHTHILPGVDDGVRTQDESISSLQTLQRLGVRRVYLTPHVMADMASNNKNALVTHYENLCKVMPSDIEIRLAAEYMLDEGFETQRENGLLTMKDNHVLVETSYMSPPPQLLSMLYETMLDGYIPIIAHPERYLYMSEDNYYELKEKGCKFQLNLFSLSGYYGVPVQKNCHYLFKQDLYDFVGSDFHSPEKYQRGLQNLNLTSSHQKKLIVLLENNQYLW